MGRIARGDARKEPNMRIQHLSIAAGALLVALAGSALGQTALGDGRGLEKNPQVGSGGYNVQAPSINDQIRMNNAIITGSAPGGRSFRGSVGYRATTDFRGSVGSDSLYSFRRDAAISGAFGAGVRGTDALRYQFALSTGQYLPSSIAQGIGSIQRSGTVSTASNAAALRSTSDYVVGQTSRPTIVGGRIDDQGYEWTAKASPLLGLTWVRSPAPVVRIAKHEDPQSKYDLGTRRTEEKTAELASSRRIPGVTGLESAAAGIESVLDRENLNQYGAINTRVQPQSTQTHAQVLDAFKSAFEDGAPATAPSIKPAGGTTKPGEKPFESLSPMEQQLELLRRRLRGEWDTPEKASPGTLPKSEPASLPESPTGTTTTPTKPGVTGSLKDFDPRTPSDGTARPTPKLSEQEEKDRREGKPTRSVFDDSQRSSVSPLTPEMVRGLKSVRDAKLESLVTPRVVASGDRRADLDAYQRHMTSGQDALRSEKFFEAEDRFTRAIAAMPGDPMAMVGRVHAQLGAGLYLSAASNLRGLFAQHPEMIGATYAPTLTPTGDRADRIAIQLREELGNQQTALSKDAALLLAYLGHIRGNRDLMLEGLSAMATRYDQNSPAESALLEACRGAWAE